MKNALVTGGTKGIGYGIAEMLLKKGYNVTITYANDEMTAKLCAERLSEISTNFDILRVNQANKEDVIFLVEYLKNKETIDCVVCNAGVTLRKELKDISDEEWEIVMQVNVNSNVYLLRSLLHKIPPHSRIIFIGSLMGIYPHATSLAYGVTKAAVHALAKNLVKCFEGSNTTVNVIAPGFVETEWQKNKPQEIRDNIYRKSAIKRFATVDEITSAVIFCIDNEFVNGSIIEISGGYCFK